MYSNERRRRKFFFGFTLAEMVLSVFIVMILASMVLINYRSGAASNTLLRVATRVAQDLRRAQNLALTSLSISGVVPYGFGVYFDTTKPNQYVIFVDNNNDKVCTAPCEASTETYEIIKIEPGAILSLVPSSPLQVLFVPPDPTTYINGANSGAASVRVYLPTDTSLFKDVIVNSYGLVEIQ